MKQREYIEGPQALKNFERFASTVMQAPKPTRKTGKSAKPTTSRKSKNSDKN
jgi:hypothetical protein